MPPAPRCQICVHIRSWVSPISQPYGAGDLVISTSRRLWEVTSGFWCLGTNVASFKVPVSSPSAHRLGHLLSDTKEGSPHPPPQDPDNIFGSVTYNGSSRSLHPGGLLLDKAINSKVICMGGFSPTRWVERTLTTHKLARCFDLGEDCLQAFDDQPLHRIQLSTLSFVISTPHWIILAVGGELSQVLTESDLAEPTEATVLPPISQSLCVASDKTICGEAVTFKPEHPADLFRREKAAKNDDTGISIDWWDQQVLALWAQVNSTTTRWREFETRFHISPCMALRKFFLRKWCRNILRSFCRFMQQTYAKLWWY